MNEFLRLERAAKRYKEQYPKGTRIELLSMNDSQAVPPGTRGTVDHVDDLGTIHMNWDNGRTLGKKNICNIVICIDNRRINCLFNSIKRYSWYNRAYCYYF